MSDLRKQYRIYLKVERGLSPNSVEAYEQDLAKLYAYCDEQGIARKAFEPAAVKALQGKDWTGNIRQLRNVVERLIILAGAKITKEDVDLYA